MRLVFMPAAFNVFRRYCCLDTFNVSSTKTANVLCLTVSRESQHVLSKECKLTFFILNISCLFFAFTSLKFVTVKSSRKIRLFSREFHVRMRQYNIQIMTSFIDQLWIIILSIITKIFETKHIGKTDINVTKLSNMFYLPIFLYSVWI